MSPDPRNEFVLGVAKYWDIDFRRNFLSIHSKNSENKLTFDLRGEECKVTGTLQIADQTIDLSEDAFLTQTGGGFANMCLDGSSIAGGIELGQEDTSIILPIFANADPRPRVIRRRFGVKTMILIPTPLPDL